MEMMYLIVTLNSSAAIIPEKYSTKQCNEIANTVNQAYSTRAICIPASNYFNCATAKADPSNGAIGVIVPTHCDISTGKP